MKVSEFIKNYRKENQLSQQQFADLIKYTQSSISQIEHGRRSGNSLILKMFQSGIIDSNQLKQIQRD